LFEDNEDNNTPPAPNSEEAFGNVEVPADIEAGARNNNIDEEMRHDIARVRAEHRAKDRRRYPSSLHHPSLYWWLLSDDGHSDNGDDISAVNEEETADMAAMKSKALNADGSDYLQESRNCWPFYGQRQPFGIASQQAAASPFVYISGARAVCRLLALLEGRSCSGGSIMFYVAIRDLKINT
jgi:hypothetical protein